MIFNILLLGLHLFSPTVKLESGKDLTLVGKGPPVVFSSGLYNTIPYFMYNKLLNKMKDKVTIVSINDFSPLGKKDIDDIAQTLNVDKISYISHSSFNPEVLESKKINKAVLIDPICIPPFSVSTLRLKPPDTININLDFPAKVYKADKLYNGRKTLPNWQDPVFNNEVESEIIPNVGHPDILDDTWADIAKQLGLWETAQSDPVNFEDWKFIKDENIKELREKYRDYIADKCLEFILPSDEKEIEVYNNTVSVIIPEVLSE